MATKLDRMLTYLDGLLPIKSNDPLITWFYKITWHIKTIIFWLPQCLCLPNLAGWILTFMGYDPSITWSCEIMWQPKIIKSTLHSAYVHQTWQAGDLPQGHSTHNATSPFHHVVLWSCEITWQTKKTLYLHCYNAYGYKTKQGDDLPWVTSTHNVTWPYNHVVV